MTLWYLILLALVQGVTEFLPISSSGHLILLHDLNGDSEASLALDVAVHIGSILAVVLYFRDDVGHAAAGVAPLIRRQWSAPGAMLALGLIVATIPALLFGLVLILTGWVDVLRDMLVIGWMMVIFGVVLYVVDRWAPETRRVEAWTLRQALLMGVAQAVSLIPGTSRSGISITAARALGFARADATRLSMLMSIPITLATGAVLMREVLAAGITGAILWPALLAAAFAFAAAYGALAVMMRLLPVVSFTPYVIYRVILGIILIWLGYS
jgi:undecaprenyl-diphosphatase